MLRLLSQISYRSNIIRKYSNKIKEDDKYSKFETVFSLPIVKYLALINRLKVYNFVGTAVALPSSGVMEIFGIFPSNTFLITSYIGLTAGAVLSMFTVPFNNVIGFLYISEDSQNMKISSINFWGKRIDKIVPIQDWIPLLDLPHKNTDILYLTPQLTDGTKYKLFIKFGKVLNAKRIGQVLE